MGLFNLASKEQARSSISDAICDELAGHSENDTSAQAGVLALSDDEIRAALERITSHNLMRKSPKLTAFLRFIVDEALAGRGNRLKAYSIGIAALGKHSAFDPTNDPIVRVEASRLRRSLNVYYATDGQHDPVRITIPSGSYQPQFERYSDLSDLAHPEIRRPTDLNKVKNLSDLARISHRMNVDVDISSANLGARNPRPSQPRFQHFILLANIAAMLITLGFGFRVMLNVQSLNARLDVFQKYWQQHLTARTD